MYNFFGVPPNLIINRLDLAPYLNNISKEMIPRFGIISLTEPFSHSLSYSLPQSVPLSVTVTPVS